MKEGLFLFLGAILLIINCLLCMVGTVFANQYRLSE